MKTIRSSITLVTTKSAWRHNPEDHEHHLHSRENIKSQGVSSTPHPALYLMRAWDSFHDVKAVGA
jgi:hypothetical protein